MKKFTLLFAMLMFSVAGFSQVVISENFDAGTPAGWTDTYGNTATNSCAGSSERDNLYSGSSTGNMTSPNQVGASNGTDLTVDFDYKVIDWSGGAATSAGWGSADLQYSTDDGATWNTVLTINDGNHVVSATCAAITPVVIPAASLPTSSDVRLRILNTWAAGDYYFYVDNFSATQVVATPPNCTTLTDPLDAATDVNEDNDLSWSVATGGATGYKLTVGTTSGGTDVLNNVDVGNVTTYDLGTLSFLTTYYVSIVPYNGNGDATGCTEESFTTIAAPPVGEVCGNPIVVGALPYSTTDETENYGDDYTGAPGASCSSTSNYLNGDDVVYSYSPGSNTSIDVDLTAIGSNYAGIFIYTDCADIGNTCVTGATNGGSTGDLAISDFLVSSGTTYYIVISTWASPQSTTYTLDITENTCVNATATYTAIPDCVNTQFTIDVDVTDLGSATSVTIGDDQGSLTQQVSGTGIVSFGPYASETSVNFTVTNDQDGTCVINGNVTYECPPANDACSDAFVVGSLPYNNSQDASAATNNSGFVSACSGGMNDGVWYTFTPDVNGTVDVVVDATSSWDHEVAIYSGSCGTFSCVVSVDGTGSGGTETLSGVAVTAGTQYWVNVGYWSGSNDSTEGALTIDITSATVLGIEDLQLSESFKFYPNPTNNVLNVSAKNNIEQLQLVNMLGQTVKTVTPNSTTYQLNIADLSSGIYFIKARVNNTEGTFRIVKQ